MHLNYIFYGLYSDDSHQGRRQRKMSRGTKQKKLKLLGYNFRSLWHTKCSIIFLRRKSGALPL